MIAVDHLKAITDKLDASIEQRAMDGVLLTCGADLVPEPIHWLWRDWLAKGKLHILAGKPGLGKSTIAMAFAATVSSGGRFPDGQHADIGNVLIWSGEDDPGDTLLPRLIASGANRERCYFVGGTRIDGEVISFDPSRHMAMLEAQALTMGGVSLLIIDPVVSLVAGDDHKNNGVRRALQPVVDLASRIGCAVVGISHFTKGGVGSDPASRVVGSVAYSAVARAVLVAAEIKTDEGDEHRILARAKSNHGPNGGGFEYHIEQKELLPDIQASYVTWGKPVSGSAKELLAEPEQRGKDGGLSAVDAAEGFLRQVLADGPTPASLVRTESVNAGFSWASVRRASDEMGVIKKKGTDAWYWSLPKLPNQDAQLAQGSDLEHLEQVAKSDDSEVF